MPMVSAADSPRKSSWIPWVFVGAMLVVVAVNAVMVTMAVRSWSGLVVEKPYERGIAYNSILGAQARQDALGWTLGATYEVTGDAYAGRVVLTATDSAGRPLDGLTVTATLTRPVEILEPITLDFTAAGDGRYIARTAVPKHGQWELRGRLSHGGDTYILTRRLTVP